jgi:thymidylate kinase
VRSIALSGPDGSGKTTTLSNFKKLCESVNVPVRIVHFYYDYLPLKLIALFKKRPSMEVEDHYKLSLRHEAKVAKKGRSLWWQWYVLFDAMLQHFWTALFSKGKLVVYDRFYEDYLVSFRFLGIRRDYSRWIAALPSPDRHYLQIASPETLHRRKPEHTMEFFRECYEEYRDVAERRKLILLDSNKHAEEELLKQLIKAL